MAYPNQTWNYDDPAGSEYRAGASDYVGYKPKIANEDKSLLISDMLTFGDDSYYSEQDYDNDEFWQAHFAAVFGGPGGTWTSGLRAVDIFGLNPKYGEIPKDSDIDPSIPVSINRFMFTTDQPSVLRKYGYQTEDGARTYSSATKYQITGDKNSIYAPFEGTVVQADENSYGKYVEISVDNYAGRTVSVLVEGMSSLDVSKGDVIDENGRLLGTAGEDGTFQISITIDGKTEDFDEIYHSFPKEYDFGTWIDSQSYDFIGGFSTGGSWSGTLAYETGKDFTDFAAGSYVNGDPMTEVIWQTAYMNGTNPMYTSAINGGYTPHQCTVIAYWRFAAMYPDAKYYGGGNGKQVARNICNANPDKFSCDSKQLVGGSFVSTQGSSPAYGHIVFIEKIDKDGGIYATDGGASSGVRINKHYRNLDEFVRWMGGIITVAAPIS